MASPKTYAKFRKFYRLASINAQVDRDAIMDNAAAKFPLCAARGILSRYRELAGRESRVNFMALLNSFTPAERARWDRDSREYPRDDYGMLPEAVEQFLQSLIDDGFSSATTTTPEAAMATAAPPKKKTAKKPSTSTGNAKFDADQKVLDGMEDVKVPAIETCIKKIVSAEATIETEKSKIQDEKDKLPGLLKKHTLEHYSAHGRDVVRIPGVDMIKFRKVKDK